MAWNPEPKIRELVDFAKNHNFIGIVGICIHKNGQFEVLSVGNTAQNCKKIKPSGDEIFKMVQSGEIEFPGFVF